MEAIKSGMQPGLTMVVGPPGTGKTDVAVQIISNIYHNWPEQRTLIVTHSNQALNQLFEKIIALDVDERHLLRMGSFWGVFFRLFILLNISDLYCPHHASHDLFKSTGNHMWDRMVYLPVLPIG